MRNPPASASGSAPARAPAAVPTASPAGSTRLTVASDGESGARGPAIDPVTLSVLWNGLISIADDMGTTLRHTAYSAAVREGDDFSTGLFDARGRLVAQGNFSPGHLGSMPYVVRHVLDHFSPRDFEPGDCILLNDSFMGSGHYPDCFMTSPLFVDGRLAGFAVNIAHHADMGGAVPGSQIVDVREAFQEGLRILPVRIVRAGRLQEDVLRLILGNVRLPDTVRGDLLAQRNTNAVAAERYAGFTRKHGSDAVEAAIETILDRSEARMREFISALPDGAFSHEDFMDDDGRDGEPLRFHVEVEVKGDTIALDWSGSSDQVEAGINSYINYTRAYSAFAIKVFTDPHLPQNDGVNRPVEIRARPGSFFNPVFPAPSSGRAINQIRLFEVVCGAFAKMRPEPAMASFSHWSNPVMGGVDDRPGHARRPFVFYDVIYGGYGGRSDKDGAEALCPVFNATNIPVEVHEAQSPILVHRMELIPDSGGAGRYRGGCGVRKDVELLASRATVSLSGDRHRSDPPGLAGGCAGTRGETLLNPDGAAEALGSKEVRELRAGDVLSFRLSGAGGYGPPSKRDEAAVRRDVADGYLTAHTARESYGIDVTARPPIRPRAHEHLVHSSRKEPQRHAMTYRNLSLEALELAFNPRATAKNLDERLPRYAAAAAESRARRPDAVLDVRYGPGEKETLDIFPAGRADAPVQLFIHGGYWRAMDKSDYSFIADAFHPAGATTVVINYDLCPTVTLDTIVVEANRSIAWTWRNIAEYGGDPDRLYVSGNSAGGHLTAMALAHDWTADGLPADVIKGAAPITGVFDCEPVLDITVNEEVRLEPEAARRLSPLRNPPRRALPLLVAVGGAEPPMWIEMSKDYVALCGEHGIECEYMELPGHDHFDVSRAAGDPESPLAQAMIRMMGL